MRISSDGRLTMVETIDHEARYKAELAIQKTVDHEKHCGERWQESRKAFDLLVKTVATGFETSDKSRSRLHDRIDGLNSRILYGVITILLSGVTTLGGFAWWLTIELAKVKGLVSP